jgi:hypothetical protein
MKKRTKNKIKKVKNSKKSTLKRKKIIIIIHHKKMNKEENWSDITRKIPTFLHIFHFKRFP